MGSGSGRAKSLSSTDATTSFSSACENGLYKRPAAPSSTAFVVRSGSLGPAGHQDHGQVGPAPAELVEQFDARHLRHHDVAHDEVELLLFEQVERKAGSRHALRVMSAPAQDLDREVAYGRLVVDDQDPHRCTLPAARGDRAVAHLELDRGALLGVAELGDEKLDQPALSLARARDDGRVSAHAELDVVYGEHFQDERDCIRGCGTERELALRLVLQADERLQRTNDLGDLDSRAVHQRDSCVELRAGLSVGKRQLRGADQPDERVRDLMEGASHQQP